MVSEQAYLTAKRTVDDRALNERVFEDFVTTLHDRAEDGHVEVIEVGAGTGTMIPRLAALADLPPSIHYRAVDRNPDHVAFARSNLPEWLAAEGYDVERDVDWEVDSSGKRGNQSENSNGNQSEDRSGNWSTQQGGDGRDSDGRTRLVATTDSRRLEVELTVVDAFEIDASADVCIAMAVLDLVHLPAAIRAVDDLLAPGGALYAPITYDGSSGFQPPHPRDEQMERWYHHHMAEIRAGGGPRAGRQLLSIIPDCGGQLVTVGGSTQVIRPDDGEYPERKALVLEYLLETVGQAVREVPEASESEETIETWLAARRDQLARRRLSFVAHNVDVLARF